VPIGKIVLEVGGDGRVDSQYRILQYVGERAQCRLDEVDSIEAMGRKPHESQAHFFLLFVKLYDSSGKQGNKIPLLDFRIHQIDGYRDGTFYA